MGADRHPITILQFYNFGTLHLQRNGKCNLDKQLIAKETMNIIK